ncbi:MAG: NAD(+)/NADH kinase [Lachnospiraceae bacterium]|jgi:NAD+ kinase|nr:NAD(+)/NADH kinase [Lachnospiraceae bacterium]
MDNFFIVTNDGKDIDFNVTEKIANFLMKKGKKVFLSEKNCYNCLLPSSIPSELDCAIVVGGDGSFIEVARLLKNRDVPILGVNMGTLGYLTEVELSELDTALAKLVNDRYYIEERMMIMAKFQDKESGIALNDIVISREGELRILKFKVYVNGILLNNYHADGIIISTPTGSTAYNLSAGGPVVEPTANLMVITPIASHALDNKSIILSADDKVEIELDFGRFNRNEVARVTLDGADNYLIHSGERVVIKEASETTKFLKLKKQSFLEVLRKKMKANA